MTVIQFISALPGSGGGSHVMTAIANELVAHGYGAMLVSATPIDYSKQYAVMLRQMGIPVIGINERSARFVGAILGTLVFLLSCALLLPYIILRRRKLAAAWQTVVAELSYVMRGRPMVNWVAASTIRNLERAVRCGPCILHVHYMGWPKCIAALKWAKRRNIPTVLHFHNDVSFEQTRCHRAFLRDLSDFLPERATIVALSKGIRREMVNKIGLGFDIKVVANWVADDYDGSAPGGPTTTLRICSVARQVGGKGLEDMIRAVAQLTKEKIMVTGNIIGAGIGHDYLVGFAERSGVDDRVSFPGETSETGVTAALKDAHVFVLVSSTEGMSIVLLKAMSLGLPVIVTPVGAHKEIVEEAGNGILVEVGNVGQLCDAIKRMILDPGLRKRMGERSREYYKSHFTSEAVWPQLENVYARLPHSDFSSK